MAWPEGAAEVPTPLLQAVLLNPAGVNGLSALEWDLLIRQGRAANLLARLGERLLQPDLADHVPNAARHHLDAALCIVERQQSAVSWELRCISQALAGTTDRLVLLKGAAYAALGLPLARSRIFSDVDILVPQSDLARVETALIIQGWQFDQVSAYDQHYYRRWMHELPPLNHRLRGTTVDVHHSLLPLTARTRFDGRTLFDHLVPLADFPGLQVLAPAAMVAHSATHLFHEGEYGNGLRDLFDLDALLRHFGDQPGFWSALTDTARRLGVQRSLWYALQLTMRMLGTPVPQATLEAALDGAPATPRAAAMLALFSRALVPVHGSCANTCTRLAWSLLYLRSHWLRMPLGLLTGHLARKAWLRVNGQEAREIERRQRVANQN